MVAYFTALITGPLSSSSNDFLYGKTLQKMALERKELRDSNLKFISGSAEA